MSAPAIPDEVLEQDVGAFAKKGAGKTYLMKGLVERLLRLQRRTVVLDPLGMWWGLKYGPKGEPGFPIAVLGGDHADLPLDLTKAEALAAWVAEGDESLIIDVSGLKRGEMVRFSTAFLAELYRLNRRALWLVLEEADVFAPMQPMNDGTMLLHVVDQICRRGRGYGFRLWTLTQRPAKLHTDVRAMISALAMLKITSPHDRAAVETWIVGNASKARAGEIVSTLASLPIGEGWIWAPDVDLLARMKFPPITTLDNSATPKAGEVRVEAKKAAALDLGPLREIMKPPVGVVVAKGQPGLVEVLPSGLHAVTSEEIARLVKDARAEGFAAGHAEGVRAATEEGRKVGVSSALAELRPVIARLEELAYGIKEVPLPAPKPPPKLAVVAGKAHAEPQGAVQADPGPPPPHEAGDPGEALARPLQAILESIWWWKDAGVYPASTNQVAYMAGYRPGTGTWKRYVSSLRSLGRLEPRDMLLTAEELERGGGREQGHEAFGPELRARVREKLPGPETKLFDVLVDAYPEAIGSLAWAERSGYSPGTGTWKRYASSIRSLELAEKHEGGTRAASWLFPERSD